MCIVSIIITNFYQKKYIQDALESLKYQTYNNFEVIIVDDTNGADNLSYEVALFPEISSKVRIYLANDIGLSACRNKGAKNSCGKYILFLDADDKIHPEFLEKTVKVLDENPKISIAYTDTQHFDGAETCWIQPEYNFLILLENNFMCSCSLIRKNDFIDAGGYDEENFNYWEDYQLWITMGAKGYYGKHVPGFLFYYRIHAESGMQSNRNRALAPLYKSYIISKFPNLYPDNILKIAQNALSKFPNDFMSWKPYQQENYIREKGVLN